MKSHIQSFVSTRAGLAGIAVAAIALTTTAVFADAYSDRSKAMKEIGGAMRTMGMMMADPSSFDGETVKEKATVIKVNFEKSKDLFPEGDIPQGSRAKENIWTENAEFMKIFDDGIAAAEAVANAGGDQDQEAFAKAFGDLGQTCKGCHTKFRAPKQ